MKLRRLVKQLSFGLVETGVDLVLIAAALELNLLAAGRRITGPEKILNDTLKLADIFKQQFLIKTGYYARKKGWLKLEKNGPVLSAKGREYLAAKLPVYRKYRPWSGRIYLVTYDISESERVLRNGLRHWLIERGGKMIQKSVWVTVYDLAKPLQFWQDRLGSHGVILISNLKKGEGVGRQNLMNLIEKLYQLGKLNRRYFNFYDLAKNHKKLSAEEKNWLKLNFLSVLADDPQLPRGLLPQAWYGDYAHELYTKL